MMKAIVLEPEHGLPKTWYFENGSRIVRIRKRYSCDIAIDQNRPYEGNNLLEGSSKNSWMEAYAEAMRAEEIRFTHVRAREIVAGRK